MLKAYSNLPTTHVKLVHAQSLVFPLTDASVYVLCFIRTSHPGFREQREEVATARQQEPGAEAGMRQVFSVRTRVHAQSVCSEPAVCLPLQWGCCCGAGVGAVALPGPMLAG